MARVAPLHHLAVKRPNRSSLRQIGIPDGRDVLAVYFWWVKQRYYRAHTEMGHALELASSVRSTMGANDDREPMSPALRIGCERQATGFDLLGVGGQFD